MLFDRPHHLPPFLQTKSHWRQLRLSFFAACLSATFFFWYFRDARRQAAVAISWPPETQPEDVAVAAHIYRSDGLLEVNPGGAHPIFELIRNAGRLWSAKLQKASKTFDEAVDEYVKRYHRLPPAGFDAW